ncbi:hypothetical protein NW768_000975 [Fusarium equiseti]|uniref:CHAT domain-containing protein n=1 Tax=Fusarium equiseti TaxID=61235 RepID=A0ABQ8RUF8_FUSEQ|nr:hypothetical protein NW768_000975 [Fusarium equiseti]
METLDHNIEEDSVTGLHGSNDPATRSASSMNDGVKLEDFPDDELALVFISDSERLQLEYMRSNEEAAEDVPLSSEQDQWDDLEFLVQGPTEEDSVLQDFSRKQESHSRIEASRKSIESLLQKSYDVSAESYRWREIGLLQAKIFSETKALDDVNQAIEAFERGVEASTSDHAVLYQNLGDLSSYLLERYKVEAHGDDLGRAIETTKMAIEMTGDTDTRRQGEQLIRLSSLLQWSYCHTYLLDDLNRALEAARDGLGLVPEDSAQRPTCHYRLGQLLTLSYSRTGIETTLDEGIHQLRLALDKAAEEDTEYSEYLATLSTSLDMKFALARSQEELLEAIELMRQSISLITERDSAFLKRLDSLAIMLGELYTTTGAIDALEESIRVARTVVSSTPDDDIHAADRMAHLSDRLEDMFQRTNDLRGLDEAIALSSTAKTITPTDHPSLHVYCHSQATKTFKRYHILKSFTDLEETIALSSQAAKLLPDTDVNTARYICLLADASLELGKTLGDTAQLRESHRLYESGLSHEYSALQERLQAGRKLFIAYIQSQNWNAAYNSARKTIDCLAYVPFADLAHREKELILDTMGWIASEGVAAALNAGRPPLEVLYLLEDSRCLVANSIVFYSEEFKRLRQRYPKKLEEFLAIRKSLKRPISGPPSGLIDNSPWNAQGKRRYEATIDCERLVAEIRSEPGFSNWLVQADETRMLKAGMKGPVIVFNASHIRSDAIIIHRDTVEVVGLPDLDYNDFEAQLDLRNPPTVANALWIWLTIAKPVLTYLGLSPVSSGIYPRLWLIPTGILTNLPIHAAGDYRNPTSESVSMLDYAVCSYSPSVKALTLARERPGLLSDNAKALLLGIEESPASARLVYTTKEISSLHDICRSRGLDVSQPNSKEGVLQALETCELFHFAAVFFNIKDDPLKSHIMLADGSITVKDILDAISRARRPILAYLSSCTTAKTLHRSFADECLHAAGALHIGGFRHAIGAQTIVDDQFCYEFSNLFYGAWPGREVSDDTVALCLHEATRTFMDQWKERELGDGRRDTHRSIVMNEEDDDDDTVMRWAAFIHLGP